MKKTILVVASLVLTLTVPAACTIAQTQTIIGDWQGALNIQGFQLRIVFHLQSGESGGLTATMDSPDQGAAGISVDSAAYGEGKLRIIMTRLQGVYIGALETGDSVLHGTWTQRGASFPLDLRRSSAPIVINRPQEPKPPYPYRSEDIAFDNTRAGITLAGTLTTPDSVGPFPAVILISGSGAQDRDENIFNHKPFKVIADYLTRHGIAALRYDDRGTAKSTGVFASATSADFSTDVEAAVRFLKSRKEIDRKKIGLIGHSEGGLIAPMVAAKSKEVAFIVLLAGPSLTGKEIILLQDSLISAGNGAAPEKIRRQRVENERLFNIIASETDTAVMKRKMRESLLSSKSNLNDSTMSAEAKEAAVAGTVDQLASPWFRFFLKYDPVPALMKVRCPVLALNGEKDLQVPPERNLIGIEKTLREGGNRHGTVKEMPGLNHLFQHATTGLPSEYAKIEETFSPEALSLLGSWIHSVVGMR